MPVRRKKSIQLFNFSFVDILATTIGVLLFIMLMAVLNVSGAVAHGEAKRELRGYEAEGRELTSEIAKAEAELEGVKKDNDKKRRIAAGDDSELKSEIDGLANANQALEKGNAALTAKATEAEAKIKELEAEIEQAQASKSDSDKQFFLPKAEGGSSATPIHVECSSDGLTILGSDVEKGRDRRVFCPSNQVSSDKGSFGDLVKSVAKTKGASGAGRKVIVLWIRPDGLDVAKQAITAARNGGASLGWEPFSEGGAF
jgi:hypothetical protein